MLWAWLPLIGVVLFFGVLCWRSWWQRRRYGRPGVLLFRSRRWPERLRDALGVVLVLFLVGQAIRAAARPQSLARLDLASHPAAEIWQVTGTALLFGGIALSRSLNSLSGLRGGSESRKAEGGRPGLVTNGFYRFCRNIPGIGRLR